MAHSRNDSSKKSFLNGKSGAILLFLGLAFGLYLSSRYNYVLFHSLSEIFSVAIAFGIFAVAWNSRRFLENHYLLLIGIASLFIGGIDFVHTLAYKGMGVFSGYEPTNLGAQLWIAARYMGALSFLAAMLLIHRKIRIGATFIIYSVITTLVLASIFYWQNFPLTFVVGSGLTPFKVISEYIISFILLCSIALLVRYRRELGTMADLMIVAMAVNIASEMAFTLYVDAYGIANMVGHFLKVLSFYFIYLAIIQTSLTKPYDHLFRSLKQREANLGEANARLEKEIAERKQAEEALARAAREWQATFDSISDLVSIQDTNFRLVKVNRAFARALGSTPEELSGKICYEVMHHTDEPVTSCPHCETLETGKPATREFFEPHLGAYLEVSTSPLRDDKGNVIGSAHIARDITERKQAEEALRETRDYLDNLFNYANAPIIVWDTDFHITRFNHAFERLTGLKAGDVLGKELETLFPEEKQESMDYIRRAVAGERWEAVEIPILRADGSVRTVLWNSATLYGTDGKTAVATIAQGQDITERKLAEVTLQNTSDELARSNAELEHFAYVASHDLQEPLRMISSYVQLLANRYRGKLDNDADEFINYATDGAARMQRLINDLLAYSRVGTRGKPFEEMSLEDSLSQALDNLTMRIKESGAAVTHDPLPVVYGDSGQITQVFQNLIDNAIKFHGEKPPRIHISAQAKEGECVCSVRDNGIGIDPQYNGKLFALFQRLHTRREYPGTGIGLAICKRIVERHGGKIWVKSEPGAGATFYFTIPTFRR